MAVSVPNTNTFSLQDVFNAVKDHTPAVSGNLSDCFAKAIPGYFDSNYNNDSYAPSGSLLRFRNYKPGGDFDVCMISNTSLVQSVNINQTYSPRATGVFLNSTGTKLWFICAQSCSIAEYTLSTAWNISTLLFVKSAPLRASPLANNSKYFGVHFNSSGTILFVVNTYEKTIEKYTLSTAWNISTLSYNSNHSVSAFHLSSPYGVWFNADGTEMWLSGQYSSYPTIVKYKLSTAFVISSGVTSNGSWTGTGPAIFYDISLNSIRSKIWAGLGRQVNQINLSTAEYLSTASFKCSFQHNIEYNYGFYMNESITKMYVVEMNSFSNIYKIHEYNV